MPLVTSGEIAALDPYYDYVALLLSGNGSNGSAVFTDNTLYPKTVTSVGNAQISTAQSKFGGSSASFDGTGDYLLVAGSSDDLAFGTGDYTIEMFVRPTNVAADVVLIDFRPAATNGYYLYLDCAATTGAVRVYINSAFRITGTTNLSGAWHHIALCRSGSSTKLFIDGVQEGATWTDSSNMLVGVSRPVIGCNGAGLGLYSLNGYIDDLRITTGIARYTANFTPPAAEFPWLAPIPVGYRGFASLLGRASFAPPEALDSQGVRNRAILPTMGKRDLYFGGVGTVAGTVKNTPATPAMRRVLLLEEATRTVIAQTWSDPITGVYTFSQVRTDCKYTVISYDHTGQYRAVIADNITAS